MTRYRFRAFSVFMIVHLIAMVAISIDVGMAEARAEVRTIDKPQPIYKFPRKSLYAVGIAENAKDLITILNGRVYVTSTELNPNSKKSSQLIANATTTRTGRLTYANVNVWNEAQLKGESRTRTNLAPLLDQILKETGYQLAGQFPFLIKGKFTTVILQKSPDEKNGTPDKSSTFSENKIDGIIIGFLTKTFTKIDEKEVPEFTMTMHFVDDLGKTVGIVEDFKIEPQNKVALFMAK